MIHDDDDGLLTADLKQSRVNTQANCIGMEGRYHPSVFKYQIFIQSNRCKVEVDNKSIDQYGSNSTIVISKLVLHTIASLIWCPYID